MRFSYNIIQKFVSKELPEAHKLAKLLTMHSFEVEEIEKVGNDHIFDIDILPNRAHDSASHIGIAREAAALTDSMLKKEPVAPFLNDPSKIKDLTVKVEDNYLCDRYMAAVIRSVEVKDSPEWLRELLGSLGLKSINNVVDAANYAMLVTGQPMHVFDLAKIEAGQIHVRLAQKGETIETLDGTGYILDGSMLVIADKESSLAIAGIKGGKKAEVSSSTRNIVLEAAHFDPLSIRNTSRKLGLHTDASWRFERDVPRVFASEGIQLLVSLIEELAGGKTDKKTIDTYSGPDTKKVLAIDPAHAGAVLGLKLTKEKIVSLLRSIEFETEDEGDKLKVIVPPFRLDIEREEDLIEEVGRLFGYENIEPKMPVTALYPPKRNIKTYWMGQIKDILSASGFNEVYNYSFVSGESADNWMFDRDDLWELENPANEELRYMRPNLALRMLKNLKDNLKFSDSTMVFEVGEVFLKELKDREEGRVGLAIGSKTISENTFFELKGYMEHLLNGLGLTDILLDDSLTRDEKRILRFMHPARVAQVKLGEDFIGFIGQVHPSVAGAENFKGGAFICELNLTKLVEEAEKEEIYSPVSIFPQSVRDISVIVPKYTKADSVISVIEAGGGKLLRDVDMFDYYQEAQNTESASMAFHLIFQAPDRTLKSEEINNLTGRIEREIKNKGWEIK